ncbi:MAG: hypothetical protein HY900_20680 [Deltaproteobacteria bacterium]|nr:hypothetical protein [Deltaproteobacteria bacterium]
MEVTKITVVGSGAMGSGIAQTCAQAGYQVCLYDVAPAQLAAATANIAKFIRRGVEKGERTAAEAEAAIGRVGTSSLLAEAVADCDLLIEAVPEDLVLKKKVFRELHGACPAKTILASNTSSLCVTEMAEASGRPEKFVGMHFFNPVPLMRLVEVVSGAETSENTLQTAVKVCETLGKSPAVVQDWPSFIVNRMARPWYYEAEFLLMEGVPAQTVDTAIRAGAGMRMGPLELMDMTGLGPHLATSETALREWGDPKWRPVPIVKKLVRSGHFGRRTGKGFYLYPDGKLTPRVPSDDYSAFEPFAVERVVVLGEGSRASSLASRLGAAGYDVAHRAALTEGDEVVAGAQLVVEAIESTDQQVGNDLFRRLGDACLPSTVLAATSTFFSPGELGVSSGRPDLTVTMHEPMPFMNNRFFEIAKGLDTGARTVATALAVAGRLGCSSVVFDETPGHIVYRVIVPMINEGAFSVFQGLASAKDIDMAMKLGLNHPLGPLEWADKLGIDTVLAIMEHLQAEFGDPRYRPCMLLKRMVRSGRLGEKSGQGFYR